LKRFPILLAAMTAVPGIATELHVFSAGQAAKAQDVNDNFQRLDTAIQNRALKGDLANAQSAILSLQGTAASKSDLTALAAKEKADSATLAKSKQDALGSLADSLTGC